MFRFDPEDVHDLFMSTGEWLGRRSFTRALTAIPYGYRGPDISKVVDGVRYRTPVLLSAGFDYNGRLTQILSSVGFGGEEIGSVTARPCEGNKRPRLMRLPRSKSLVVYKGLRNDGVDAIMKRLKSKERVKDFVIGVSIARTNDAQSATTETGIADYYTSLEKLTNARIGDYYTINISCPNATCGETFIDPAALEPLLDALDEVPTLVPRYIKMPVSVPMEQFDALLAVIAEHEINGVIIGNLNKHYNELAYPDEAPKEYHGGLSGKVCFTRSNERILYTKRKYGDALTIIGCGGIFSPEDAMEKFRLGADLLQLITGMIFEGPGLIKNICKEYAKGVLNKKAS